VLKRQPDHVKTLTQLGILYLDHEEYEKAAEHLKRALTANRQSSLALVSMGRLLFETGYASNAVKYHLRALNYNNREMQAMIGIGNAYYELGKL
jgi:tetratricopeptide (TPR) repeat protein